jgi:hypothetical protein
MSLEQKVAPNLRRWRISWRTTLACILCLLAVMTVPGCGGCQSEDPVAKKKREDDEIKKKKQKDKEKIKEDFEFDSLISLPNEASLGLSDLSRGKPGHWVTLTQFVKANNFDYQADEESQLLDYLDRRLDIDRTPFQITISRPAVLPKGQIKNFETIIPMSRPPQVEERDNRVVRVKNTFYGTRGGKTIDGSAEPVRVMPDFQYYFVVLARDPDNYSFLKRTSSVNPPSEERQDASQRVHYRVLLPKLQEGLPTPVPTHPLTWTSTAYVLWDGALPSRLSPEQQQALLDWVHWGGQLIISGPRSLDDLKGSFLEAYLPAEKVRSLEFTGDDFDELNQHYSIPSIKHAFLTGYQSIKIRNV